VSAPTTTRRWLADDGAFLFGKYKGELAEDVASEDSGYVRWAVDTVEDMDEGDRDVLTALLAYRLRSRGRR
jgi:hypothetical protein